MTKSTLITFAAATLTLGQTTPVTTPQNTTAIHSASAAAGPAEARTVRPVQAARPLLGYLLNESNVLYSVVGSRINPSWGEPLELPVSTTRSFLPSRQEYALLASDTGLSVARLGPSALQPGALIPKAVARPDQVAFSPSGVTAALYSRAESRMEIVTGLPADPQVRAKLPLGTPDELTHFAISDDGEVLVASFANRPGAVCSTNGASWLPLRTNFNPDAWTFLPLSHDLVLSDRTRKAIVILEHADHDPFSERIVALGSIDADLLAVNKWGTALLAVKTGTTASWSLNLPSGIITPQSAKDTVDSLTLLRDGQTFLISAKESPRVLTLSVEAPVPATNGRLNR